MGQQVKNLPAMQETQDTQVRTLGQEDPLEKEVESCSSVLAGKSHGQRSLAGYSPCSHQKSDTTKRLSTHKPLSSRK